MNAVGKQGEEIACEYLKSRGYAIIATNYQTRYGEIDIICQDEETLIFVEVKTRTDNSHGFPYENISGFKQIKMERAAAAFLRARKSLRMDIRFDAISILITNTVPSIQHFYNIIEL